MQLTDVVTGETMESEIPKGLSGRHPMWLTRLLPPLLPGSQSWCTMTTPYHLTGDADDWREYLERTAGPSMKAQVAFLRRPPSSDYWLKYIVGFARPGPQGTIELMGVPDDVERNIAPHVGPPGPELDPSELMSVLNDMVLSQLRDTLDQPIPLLGNDSPRRLARTKDGAAKVREWLRGQEEIFRGDPMMSQIDLSELWDELGLKRD